MKRSIHTGVGRPSDFEWLDRTNVGATYSNFAKNEPNFEPVVQGNIANCVVFFIDTGNWKTQLCSDKRYYVCQRYAGTFKMFSISLFCFTWYKFKFCLTH